MFYLVCDYYYYLLCMFQSYNIHKQQINMSKIKLQMTWLHYDPLEQQEQRYALFILTLFSSLSSFQTVFPCMFLEW